MELTKSEHNKLKADIKRDLMRDFEGMIEKEVLKQLKGKAGKREVKEITTEVLVNLFRVMWNRSSMWKGDVKR
jgi:hypothetical protein